MGCHKDSLSAFDLLFSGNRDVFSHFYLLFTDYVAWRRNSMKKQEEWCVTWPFWLFSEKAAVSKVYKYEYVYCIDSLTILYV